MFPCLYLQHQKRQQKLDGRVTLDSLASSSPTESEQTDPTADAKDEENADIEKHEGASLSEDNHAQISASKQDQGELGMAQDEVEKEDEEDSVIDCDSPATSSVSNRFTILSEEEQHSKDSIIDDDKTSDMDQGGEEDSQLVSEMEKVTLDDAFIEDTGSVEQVMESEDEALEAKEYTVVNQDPELAFQTLAARTAPEKQECSVQSCLFQFTEVETLTQNNSLLCVTCTKRQSNKDKSIGMRFFYNYIWPNVYLFFC